jgi:large subunit ribosomal protein L4
METAVYNQKGESVGKIKLPESVFGLPWNADLVHQVVVSMTSSARNPIAHTKTRGEVRGGGKKPWKQKGTGQARHGSTRSPIWVGGGVTHGPRNDKNYDRKVNKKMKSKALYTILSKKMRDGEVVFVDEIKFKDIKTSQAADILKNLKGVSGLESIFGKKNNAALIALGEHDAVVMKSFRNIGNVAMDEIRNINPVSLLQYKGIVIVHPESSLRNLESRLSSGQVSSKEVAPKKEKVAKVKKVTAKK